MRIIPAIDIIKGKCVRLTRGEYSTKKIYNENPLEVAKQFEDFGIQYLHLVDLDGARSDRIINHSVLENLAIKTNLKIDFGGGLKSDKDLKIAFECGANQITGGSTALHSPEIFKAWLKKYGNKTIILGADSKNEKIAVSGWTQYSDVYVTDYIINYEKEGIQYVIPTDISKDGMLQGPSFDLYKKILNETNINLIASGGVSSINDLIRLKEIGCEGVIVGKAIYEKKISLHELSELC